MKRISIIGLTVLLLARLASAQSNSFVNNAVIVSPPDPAPHGWALNYINNNSITVSFTAPFHFFDVLNFTNQGLGTMSSALGFRFDTTPSSAAPTRPAVSFVNATTAKVVAGSNTFWTIIGPAPAPPVGIGVPPPVFPQVVVAATNITSPGLLGAAMHGLVSIKGNNVNLNRSPVHIETFGDAIGNTLLLGIFDLAWEVANQNDMIGAANFVLPDPASPATPGGNSVTVPGAQTYANVIIRNTNLFDFQFIFVGDSGGQPGVTVDAGFDPGNINWVVPVVQWTSITTNSFGHLITNRIVLRDQFAIQNGTALKDFAYTPGGVLQQAPTNYTISTPPLPVTLTPGNIPYDPNVLTVPIAFNPDSGSANTEISFWAVQPKPFTLAPDPTDPLQNGAAVPGRIEITAEGPGSVLDIQRARFSGPNAFKVTSTNHITGSGLAQILAYQTFLNLGSTNGQLRITNLVAPFLARVNGDITMWSAKWENFQETNLVVTNIDMSTGTTNFTTNDFEITNRFHVLMAGSILFPTSPAFVGSAQMRSTNVEVSDILNMTSNLLVNAQNLTITSNNPPRPNAVGEIHLLPPTTIVWLAGQLSQPSPILWSPSFPILQNLTNFGLISSANTIFFSHRATPDFASPGDSPYLRMVNHGRITSAGANLIWTGYFENTGLGPATNYASITSGLGDLTVTSQNVLLANGDLNALSGSMSFNTGTLVSTNHTNRIGGILTLAVTTNLTDNNVLGNLMVSGDGIQLPLKPLTGDLLGTTIQLNALPNAEVNVFWAGEDRGPGTAGYTNNVAVGHLVLFGGDEFSSYHFIGAGPGASNAIYVDLLELAGGATDANAFNIDPNFTIYFSRATNTTTVKDLTLTLDGAFGGRIQAVAGFAGLFHAAPASLPGNNIGLTITVANQPLNTALVSWQAVANKTNSLYSSPTFSGTNWTLVTNIVQGAVSSPVTIAQPASGPAKYYKVVVH